MFFFLAVFSYPDISSDFGHVQIVERVPAVFVPEDGDRGGLRDPEPGAGGEGAGATGELLGGSKVPGKKIRSH